MINGLTGLSTCSVDTTQWLAETRARFLPLEVQVKQVQPFEVDARLTSWPGCRIVHVRASEHSTSMGIEACGSLPKKLIKVLWQRQGSARIEQRGRQATVAAGNWTAYEPSTPFECQMHEGAEFSALLLEADAHGDLLALTRRIAGRAFPTEGAAAVALATLSAASGTAQQQLEPRCCESIIAFVCSLLRQTLQELDGGPLGARQRAVENMLMDARHFVREHLDDPDLSPDRIAQALRVSRRTLYNSFGLMNETPQAFVQRERLERSKTILSQDRSASASITQLALEVGFIDPGYFTRAFRRHFGRSPSQFRAGVRAGEASERAETPLSQATLAAAHLVSG